MRSHGSLPPRTRRCSYSRRRDRYPMRRRRSPVQPRPSCAGMPALGRRKPATLSGRANLNWRGIDTAFRRPYFVVKTTALPSTSPRRRPPEPVAADEPLILTIGRALGRFVVFYAEFPTTRHPGPGPRRHRCCIAGDRSRSRRRSTVRRSAAPTPRRSTARQNVPMMRSAWARPAAGARSQGRSGRTRHSVVG